MRIPDELAKKLDALAREHLDDRSGLIRRILRLGTRQMLLERALEEYRARRVSLWKAAEMAGVTLREIIDRANQAMIPIAYDRQDLERDLEFVKRVGRGE